MRQCSCFLVSLKDQLLTQVALPTSLSIISQYHFCAFAFQFYNLQLSCWNPSYVTVKSLILLIVQLHLLLNNPLGNLNSGRRPWAKLTRSASLQHVFDAAIAKLLCRLVSRCFYKSICVLFYDNVELKLMRCNSTKQSPDGDTEMSLTVMYAVCRLLDKFTHL